ncbi:DUF1048 domain-containing protein [Candidatus Enterococcus wittei]|nr:DUF1048 domain-containing protein [Enterococcus sp. 10A9_DIV0425]
MFERTKKEYQTQVARVEKMPADYQTLFQSVHDYLMASYGGFDGLDVMQAVYHLVDVLDEAVAEGISAKEFAGDDFLDFAQRFGKESEIPTWMTKREDKKKEKMNKKIQKKLGGK